jgi:hypothetical protein
MKTAKHDDKQLRKLEHNEVLKRRRLDLALNIKQFALAAESPTALPATFSTSPVFPPSAASFSGATSSSGDTFEPA